jgi:hypothetical protein
MAVFEYTNQVIFNMTVVYGGPHCHIALAFDTQTKNSFLYFIVRHLYLHTGLEQVMEGGGSVLAQQAALPQKRTSAAAATATTAHMLSGRQSSRFAIQTICFRNKPQSKRRL